MSRTAAILLYALIVMLQVSSCCACPADTISSLTSRNLSRTAITHSSCNGASVVISRSVAGYLHCPVTICVRICGMRSATSSTCGLASGHHLLSHVHRDRFHCKGLATHGSATVRDFHLSWDFVVGSLLVVLCGASWRSRHRCTVGIDRDPHVWCSDPGRMTRTLNFFVCEF